MMIDLPRVDRRIAVAASELHEAVRALRGQADVGNPLEAHRPVSTRTAYRELGDLPRTPDVVAARRWIHLLTIERVTWRDRVRLASAYRAPTIALEKPERATLSVADLIHRVLGEASDKRRAWADGLEGGGRTVVDAARILAERRAEADALLRKGGEGEALEAIAASWEPEDALPRIVQLLLELLPPIDPPLRTWDDAVERAVARGVVEGWPARLTPRWIGDLFRGTGLTDGLALGLPDLPVPIGASSFARALGAFGAAVSDADGPDSAPYCLGHPPFELRRERRAALFAGLVADPVFFARGLGVGRLRAHDQARDVARAFAVALRFDALRVGLGGVLMMPERAREQRFEQETERALGVVMPAPLAGVVPRLSHRDGARLAGSLLAMADRRRLVERFDEDWFRSPHAARAIREEDSVLAPERVAEAELEAAARAVATALSA